MTELSKVKSKNPRIEKGFQFVAKDLSKKQKTFKKFDRALTVDDLKENDYAIVTVKALSESPSAPTADEVRLYHRFNGKLYKLTFEEI